MRYSDARLRAGLDWIVGLPPLGDVELGSFVGVDEAGARGIREELARRGWVEWVTPRGHGQHARPLAVVRDEALPSLAALLGIPPVELAAHVPVGRQNVLERLGRIDAVQGINRMLSTLAVDLRASGEGAVESACSLPLSRPPDERTWPHATQAHVRLRAGETVGECYVAWDRAGAPDLHRRDVVRRWFQVAEETAWSGDPERPLTFVVCAGERELKVWEMAVLRHAESTGIPPGDVLLATAAEVLHRGARDTSWLCPGAGDGHRLMDWIEWEPAPAETGAPDGPTLPSIPRTTPDLRSRLIPDGRPLGADAPVREQVASLALVMDPQASRLLEWVARHPWLTTTQLSVLLDDPEEAVSRRLDTLVKYGTVQGVRADGDANILWIATRRGLRPLAASDQVSLTKFQHHGAVAAPVELDGTAGWVVLPRAFEHELGVNRTMVRLATAARRDGGRLVVWRNEAESTQVFRSGNDRRWIRPDGSGLVELGDSQTPFLLEYDRGTLKRRELESKFRAYNRYFEFEAWDECFDAPPLLLFVCADARAVRRATEAASAAHALTLPLLVTSEEGWGGDLRGDPRATHLARMSMTSKWNHDARSWAHRVGP